MKNAYSYKEQRSLFNPQTNPLFKLSFKIDVKEAIQLIKNVNHGYHFYVE